MVPKGLGLIAACLLTLVGCGRDNTTFGLERSQPDATVLSDGGLDASVPDGTFPDASAPDAGPDGGPRIDVGFPDASRPDAFVPDIGFPPFDGGQPDASRPDASRPDASRPDTGLPPDGGPPDASGPDAGPTDSGPGDTGAPDGGIPCPMGCGFLDSPCIVGVCAPDGLSCLPQPRPTGTACNDGDLCTANDSCRLGACVAGPPVDCSGSADACNSAFCDAASGLCQVRPVPDGLPCDDGNACTVASCAAGVCTGASSPTPGDSCLSPVVIALQPGVSVETGNNQCAVDNATGVCGAVPGGQDVVYQLQLAGATRRLVATTETPAMGMSYDTLLHLRSTCDMPSSLACNDDSGGGLFSQIDVILPGTQDAFLFADAFGPGAIGDYQLRLEVDPQNTCANPSTLDLQTAPVVRGNTTGADNTFQAPCAAQARSPDHVYELTLSTRVTLRIDLVDVGATRFDTALHVRSSTCAAGGVGVIACDDDGGQRTNSRIERTFDPGTYYVIVDGFGSGSVGEYELSVTQTTAVESVIFPDIGDARQPLNGIFSTRGQFVEGIRNASASSVSRLEVDLQVANNMTCGRADIEVRLNNTRVGRLVIIPGQTQVSALLSGFAPVGGGRYNIRYELQQGISSGCGTISFPDGVSTVGLGL